MAYRRRQGITRGSTFKDQINHQINNDDDVVVDDDGDENFSENRNFRHNYTFPVNNSYNNNESENGSLAARAIMASAAHRDSVGYGYAYVSPGMDTVSSSTMMTSSPSSSSYYSSRLNRDSDHFQSPSISKAGYNWICGESEKIDWWPWMQNSWILPKHRFIMWIIAHKKLLTRARMQHLNMTSSGNCYICDDELETVDHLFSRCRYSRNIFEEIGMWCGVKLPEQDCINWWLKLRERSATKKKFIGVILANCIYSLWIIRNGAKFDIVVKNQKYVIQCIKKDVIRRLDIIETKTHSPKVCEWIERLRIGGTG